MLLFVTAIFLFGCTSGFETEAQKNETVSAPVLAGTGEVSVIYFQEVQKGESGYYNQEVSNNTDSTVVIHAISVVANNGEITRSVEILRPGETCTFNSSIFLRYYVFEDGKLVGFLRPS